MQIHTMKDSECLSDIAKEYGVCEDSLKINNGIADAPALGEELLVLTPTRTHTLGATDTPERMMLRFGVTRRSLLTCNPQLATEAPEAGDTLIIRYSEPPYGMGVANGTVYRGCSTRALKRALPFLTYLTVASVVLENGEARQLFDDREVLRLAEAGGKIPILRIYARCDAEDYATTVGRESLSDRIVSLATERGYRGVLMSSLPHCDGVGEFLLTMRRKMIGCDLILLCEIDENSPEQISELSDGSIFFYSKCAHSLPESYECGEKRAFESFAHRCESSKTMIELPTLAAAGDGYLSVCEALMLARKRRYEILTDEATLLSRFGDGRKEYVFPSLSNIKATLDAVYEYGFMGVSIDVMRTPISYLAMYNALFKPALYTGVRSAEGCSREP